MKTIIFDIDGTLTTMWPIERAILIAMGCSLSAIEDLRSKGTRSPYLLYVKTKNNIGKSIFYREYEKALLSNISKIEKISLKESTIVDWIRENGHEYNIVYVTGGTKSETECALRKLDLDRYFDLENSISKSTCRYSKKTGIPFRRLKWKFDIALFVTDSEDDCIGATKAGIPCIII